MPTAWIIEAVDVLKDGGFGLASGLPCAPPDQLGLDRLEEGLDGSVIVAIALAAHRHLEPMLAQDLLIVVRTVLAAAIAVEDRASGRRPEGDRHLQRPDRQIAFHAVADSPADHAAGMQVEDHSQIQPALAGPDIADVARPFPIGSICREVTVQQVRRDIEPVVAVGPSSGK